MHGLEHSTKKEWIVKPPFGTSGETQYTVYVVLGLSKNVIITCLAYLVMYYNIFVFVCIIFQINQ